MGLATVESEYLGGGARLTCSDRTAADVDTEVMETLKQCYEEAKEMLQGNRELMDKIAAHLIEKETISGKEFMKIYREEKGIPEPEEKEKAESKTSADVETTVSEPEVKEPEVKEPEVEIKEVEPEPQVQENENAGNEVKGRFSNTSSNFFEN